MTIFDRYLIRLFLKIFAVCFFSMSGLFVVVHLFSNFDEVMQLADRSRGLPQAMLEFYGPRVLDFFDRTVGILILTAAVFAIAWMQRNQEMSAVQAAGISRLRMIRPLVVMALVMMAIAVYVREAWLPRFREQLVQSAQNWKDDEISVNYFQKDHQHGMLVKADKLDLSQQRLSIPVVQLPIHLSPKVRRILGDQAGFVEAEGQRPAGLLIDKVQEPTDVYQLSSIGVGGQSVIYFPGDTPWLEPQQCFVATTLTFDDMLFGQQSSEYSSLRELIATAERPTQWFSQATQMAIHMRVLRPVVDLLVLLIALPVVIGFTEHNRLLAALSCLGFVGVFQIIQLGVQSLGAAGLLGSPAFAAWIPVFLFAPLTPWSLGLLKR